MRRKEHVRIEPRSLGQASAPTAASVPDPAYPSLHDAQSSPELASLVRAAVRAAACIGLLGAAGAASGCEAPACEPTRWGEVKAHVPSAASDAARLELGVAVGKLAVAFGISPHPAPTAMAGEMVSVSPTPPVAPPAPPSGDSGSGGVTQ